MSFGRKTALLVVLRVMSAALNYGTIAVAALVLSASDYGHFGTIMAFLTFAGVLARFGSDVSVVRFLGEYRSVQTPELAAGLVTSAQRTVLVASLLIGLLSAPFWYHFPQYNSSAEAYLLAGLLILPFFALADTESGIIRSYGGVMMAIVPRDVIWRLALILILLAVWHLGLPLELRLGAVLVVSAPFLCFLVALQVWYQTKLRQEIDGFVSKDDLRSDWPSWRRASLTIWVLLVARVSLRSVDVLVIGITLSVDDAGVYFLVSRTAELMGFVLTSLNLVVGPLVAKGHAEGKTAMISKRLSQVSVLLFISTLPILLGLVFAGESLLMMFGEKFTAGYEALVILALGQFVNVAFGGCGVVLNMTGHERTNARALLWAAPLSLILLSVLAPTFGMIGAAFAITLGITVWNLWIWIEVRRLTPYDPSFFGALAFFLKLNS